MKRIPSGTTKYLMFDAKTLERNVERSGRGAPAVVVVEVDDAGAPIARHIGYTVQAEGPLVGEIFVRGNSLWPTRAAFSTKGEVVLDADDDANQPLSMPIPPAVMAVPRKPPLKKVS